MQSVLLASHVHQTRQLCNNNHHLFLEVLYVYHYFLTYCKILKVSQKLAEASLWTGHNPSSQLKQKNGIKMTQQN